MRWKATVVAAALVAGGVIIVRTQFVDISRVSSDSMAPTVCVGDTVLTVRLDDGSGVEVDDIVTFPNPQDGTQMIKRVVALAGQRVAIADAELVVDGSTVAEPYVDRASIDGVYFGPVTVPDGSVFVMGDHRETSIDSRIFGSISTSAINGRLVWDMWSKCDD